MIFAAHSLLNEAQRALTTEDVTNLYVEGTPGREAVTLRSVPGLVQAGQLASGRVRAMQSTKSGIYAAVAGRLVLWAGGTATDVGAISDGPTTMAWNGSQLSLTAGGNNYLYDGSTLRRIPGAAFDKIGSVEYVDGYFARTELNGQLHDISALNDGSVYDGLDFASAEKRPDDLVRVITNGGLIWYMGTDTVEAWQNTGATDFPFARVPSAVSEKGLRAVDHVAGHDNTIFWVSGEGWVYRMGEAYQPQKISTSAVDYAIGRAVDITCFPYQHEGHDFFVVRRSDGPAWVYDASTQAWHKRATGASLGAWEVTATVRHNNTWYAGTRGGYLCTFGGFQDRGLELRREATSRNVSQDGERFIVSKVDVRCETGLSGVVMSSYTKDGGRTFSPERSRSLSGYASRQQWRGLGQAREFAFRLACTDNVDFAIYEAGIS